MRARYLSLPFVAEALGPVSCDGAGRAERVVVSNGRASAELDLATCVARRVPGEHPRTLSTPAFALGALRARALETVEGPRTDLVTPEAPDTPVASFAGELLDAARAGALVSLNVAMPGARCDAVFLRIDRKGELRLPSSYTAALAIEGAYAIAVASGMLHAARADDTGLSALSLSIPPAPRPDARIVGGEALVLSGPTLVLVTLDDAPFSTAGHRSIAVTFAPIVLATLGASSLVDRPPPLELAAPDVAPLSPSVHAPTGPSRPRSAHAMREIARRWGFAVPPALEAFLSATDADAVLTRWLSRLGIAYVEVTTLDGQADPCLVAIAGRGDGDAVALYLYPPSLALGEEPPVVEYWHETNECSFVAPTFDDFLGGMLDESAREAPEIVGFVRARLGVTPRRWIVGSPPEWLPKPNEAARPRDEVEAAEARGDLEAAERGWLEHYVAAGPDRSRAREALLRLYARLGWSGALDALRRSAGDGGRSSPHL